jgi:hypothetical protein
MPTPEGSKSRELNPRKSRLSLDAWAVALALALALLIGLGFIHRVPW